MRTAAEHSTLTNYREGRFITLLLLELDAALHYGPKASQHCLLLPGVPGHQYFDLLLHQIQALCVIPQAIFQQNKVDRRNGIAPAKEGAGLE